MFIQVFNACEYGSVSSREASQIGKAGSVSLNGGNRSPTLSQYVNVYTNTGACGATMYAEQMDSSLYLSRDINNKRGSIRMIPRAESKEGRHMPTPWRSGLICASTLRYHTVLGRKGRILCAALRT